MFILDTRLVRLIFTFAFIRRPISLILSPSSRTFVELTLVNHATTIPMVQSTNFKKKTSKQNLQEGITPHVLDNHESKRKSISGFSSIKQIRATTFNMGMTYGARR
jgi:hypothetical protein